MISEITFSHSYSSFWKSAIPMAEQFIRRLNLHLERFNIPIGGVVHPTKRALINEIAFRTFKYCVSEDIKCNLVNIGDENFQTIIEGSRKKISLFSDNKNNVSGELSKEELFDIFTQGEELVSFFKNRESVSVSPIFQGCGVLDKCAGDVLADETLYEIKAGIRNFRSIDLRQLLTYCALNYAAKEYEIKNIGLFNPRLGVYVEIELDDICRELSSKSPPELLGDIVYAISRGDLSK